MTVNQLRQLALRMGACAELFIRARLKRQEIPEETEWVEGLLEDAGYLAASAETRLEARRLYWEAALGMSGDWPKAASGCFEQGNCNGV